jgi:hypothetical protein
MFVATITPITKTFAATIRVRAALHEFPWNGRTNNRSFILISSGMYFTVKTASWRQNKHHKLGFAGRVPAGGGMVLRAAGSAEIVLSSI